MFNSRLYRCRVYHERYRPRTHKFSYGVFMLCLDLAELPQLANKSRLFAVNRPALVSFYEADHLLDSGQGSLLARVRSCLAEHGFRESVQRIELLTYPRIFGYVFNPVSFYFIYGHGPEHEVPRAVLVEVSNTFKEMKVYLAEEKIAAGCLSQRPVFRSVVPKHFYVSPFGKLDDCFDFIVPFPDERLKICIDTLDGESGDKVLVSSLSGKSLIFSDRNLLGEFFRHPLMTFKVIAMIHFHALLLLLKRTPFYKKEDKPHLQTEVINPRHVREKRA
ncbi:MAG: DUF1365 domain-containing protein [Candidatus Obscuribacter sp.]|nr:DUF1365 domain-containing protein [Candidatus Obscuribacter sp.]